MKITLNLPSKIDFIEFYSSCEGLVALSSEEKSNNAFYIYFDIESNKIKFTDFMIDGDDKKIIDIDDAVMFQPYFDAILKLHSDAIESAWNNQFSYLDETTYEETVSPQCR